MYAMWWWIYKWSLHFVLEVCSRQGAVKIHAYLTLPLSCGCCHRSLMRGLGGFFIRRRMDRVAGRRDHIYRAVLQTVSFAIGSFCGCVHLTLSLIWWQSQLCSKGNNVVRYLLLSTCIGARADVSHTTGDLVTYPFICCYYSLLVISHTFCKVPLQCLMQQCHSNLYIFDHSRSSVVYRWHMYVCMSVMQ